VPAGRFSKETAEAVMVARHAACGPRARPCAGQQKRAVDLDLRDGPTRQPGGSPHLLTGKADASGFERTAEELPSPYRWQRARRVAHSTFPDGVRDPATVPAHSPPVG
jgi:hypothetical protein